MSVGGAAVVRWAARGRRRTRLLEAPGSQAEGQRRERRQVQEWGGALRASAAGRAREQGKSGELYVPLCFLFCHMLLVDLVG